MPIDLTADDVRLLVDALQRDMDDYVEQTECGWEIDYNLQAAHLLCEKLKRFEQESLIPF
jgi:hypothetical protein